MQPKRFESTTQPGLFFWAEPILMAPVTGYMVVSQADGFPSTEAWDDWFAHEKDAERLAEMLAKGEAAL